MLFADRLVIFKKNFSIMFPNIASRNVPSISYASGTDICLCRKRRRADMSWTRYSSHMGYITNHLRVNKKQ